ncbi:methyltransferase domain-containing protein [Rhodovulum sp. DZ06]|uniref:methyltransferase domain-containing protein n=1 Tax=Rhodovulum sp. DZ06 TaxID=3425126 RepID=UPI003D338587
MTRPDLFDRALLLSRRAARGAPAPGADFLHAHAAAGIAERLEEVARDFPRAALVHPGADAWAETLRLSPKIGALDIAPLAEAEVLELEQGAYDLVVGGLSLHWANDPVGLLIQMRRALKPDGLLLVSMFGGQTLAELRAALAEAEAAEEGGLSPRVAPMGEIRDLGALLQRAGLAMPVADSESLDVTYESPLALMRELRAMGETNVMTARRRSPMRRATLARAAALYAERFPAPDPAEAARGRVRASFEIVTLTGWAPGEGQPTPKRPGSAGVRLADALGAEEFKLPRSE